MIKIGICACYTNRNYGSMLQSLATITTFERESLACEFIRYEKKKTPGYYLRSIPRLLNYVSLSDKYLVIQKKIMLRLHPDAARENNLREGAFDYFIQKYFTRLSPVYLGYEALKIAAGRYDGVITGSDQVWSPSALATHFYDLTFVPDRVYKASYASSFGVKKIPWYQAGRTRAYLERIQQISVREVAGQDIVRNFCGREVPVVCDPTLLFDAEGWALMLPAKRLIEERYAFAYFLGAAPEQREAAQRIAGDKKLKLVAIHHMDQYVPSDMGFGDIVYSNAGPEEFVNLIRGAECVLTDSFHGTIFSILHHKPFITFNRYPEGAKHSKNSRIDSLCTLLGLSDRRFSGDTVEKLGCPIAYERVDAELEKLRQASRAYITEVVRSIAGDGYDPDHR